MNRKRDPEEQARHDTWLVAWEQRQKDFVLHSEQISGRGYDDPDVFWKRDGVRRHFDLAKYLNVPGVRYIGIQLINSTLTNRKNDWFRTGIEGMFKGQIPDGKLVPQLVEALDAEIIVGIEVLRDSSDEQAKDLFAWHAHDELLCHHAFKSRNGRTARVLLNHIRALVGLDTFVIDYAKSDEYYEKLRVYKEQIYLPRLREMQLAA